MVLDNSGGVHDRIGRHLQVGEIIVDLVQVIADRERKFPVLVSK